MTPLEQRLVILAFVAVFVALELVWHKHVGHRLRRWVG